MTATLKTTIIQEPSSATANMTLGTTGGVTFGAAATINTITSAAATNLTIQSAGTTAMTIDTNGNLLVGHASVGSGDRFVVQCVASGTIMLGYNSSATNTYQILENGNVRNTNNSYGAISDVALKENIVDATPKLSDLMQVKIRNYNLKSDKDKTKQIGVVAQELETVFPAMIETNNDGIKGVKYSVFVPMLVKAIQEQQATITTLTARIATLEAK